MRALLAGALLGLLWISAPAVVAYIAAVALAALVKALPAALVLAVLVRAVPSRIRRWAR
jgi:hypothetical protein